ncbi:MAG: hypothetical protein K2V38_26600, partial [Gemmataceae bacterium]|nr:hypothetical protein [Gemmataceae bacterium]
MLRLTLVALLTLPPAVGAQQPKTHQVKLNGHTFTLPEGFSIEVAAGADIAPRPIAAALDEKGRLYVTDSSGSNENVKIQLEKKPHRILRLESTKGDGKFDKQTVFVKNVMFPEGCMWMDGSLYVAAPPHILKFTDTDNDGVADKEEIWFDGKTLTGCANDLHGPYRGPDGYIYWTKGAFAKQEYTVNGKKMTTRAAHIFRAKPDGSNLEPVMTGGMDNPVDLVFTPSGDIIFSTTFFQHPAGGKRDGLVHAIYGAVYGKDHDVVYEHPWTSPQLMPPMTHMGPAAPAGLHRYESDSFGKEYENNIFCCQFNLRKVSRHVLVTKGSTYETHDSDFVVSDNIDFHPTDVIEDADGSLLIVDTGGWYKLCCPTSQLVKPDVTGAIYRVKKAGAHKERTQRKPDPLPRLREISLTRDPKGFDLALEGLKSPDLHTRRLAAEALGRLGRSPAVPAILTALEDEKNDRALDHALAYALIQIDDPKGTLKGLGHPSPRVRRACLAALSNLSEGVLGPRSVLAELDAKDPALRDTAWWVVSRRPQWAAHFGAELRDRTKWLAGMTPEEQDAFAARFGPLFKDQILRKITGDLLLVNENPGPPRALLKAMATCGLKFLPDEWRTGVRIALNSPSPDTVWDAIQVLRALPPNEQQHAKILEEVSEWRKSRNLPLAPELAYAFQATAPAGFKHADEKAVLADLHRDRPGPVRAAAADLLTRAGLTDDSLVSLTFALKTVSPLELPKLLGAFDKSKSEKVGLALVAALRQKDTRAAVRAEMVKPILDKYPAAVKAEAEKLYAELAEARKGETARLDQMLKEMKPGDVRRGQLVFNSPKTNCIA